MDGATCRRSRSWQWRQWAQGADLAGPGTTTYAAILEIAAPAGAKITIDGHDCTGQKEVRFEWGPTEEEREIAVEARLPDDSKQTQRVLIRRCWHIPLYIRAASSRAPELVPQSGRAGIPTFAAFGHAR